MVWAGQLRRRLTLEQRATTVDDAGQVDNTWTTANTFSGSVLDKGGAETIKGDQVSATTTTVVIMRTPRNNTTPTPQMRLTFDHDGNTRTLNIESVQHRDAKQRELWLYCSEAS